MFDTLRGCDKQDFADNIGLYFLPRDAAKRILYLMAVHVRRGEGEAVPFKKKIFSKIFYFPRAKVPTAIKLEGGSKFFLRLPLASFTSAKDIHS